MTNSATIPPPSASAEAPSAGWRWAPHWVLAFVALWPAPGYAEGVMVLGALAAIVHLLVGRFRGGMRLLSHQAWALTSVLFCAYWLPQLVSSFDALDHGRACGCSHSPVRTSPGDRPASSTATQARACSTKDGEVHSATGMT